METTPIGDDLVHHLRRILPAEPPTDTGFYCAAQLTEGGNFRHRFYGTIQGLAGYLAAMDEQGHKMYVAQALFKTNENRKGVNAKSLKSFFMDIDVGPSKPYATQEEAHEALMAFVDRAKLPQPVVESSGYGLYARWILTKEIDPDRWRVVGGKLKQLARHHKFEIDPVRTADVASVLRPMGVCNRKDAKNPIRAGVVIAAPDVEFGEFAAAINGALSKAGLPTQGLTAPKKFEGMNDQFSEGIEDGPPSFAANIAQKCNAMREFKSRKGDVAEPIWYDLIGVLRHCQEGDDLIQEWSAGHPAYSPAETEKKITQHREGNIGPTTCEKIGSDDASLCVGCKWSGKIKSPIVLGRAEAEVVETITEEEVQELPDGFRRTERGLECEGIMFYPYDLYPVKYAFDHTLGYEVMTIRHRMPVTRQYKEFSVRSALMLKPTELLMALQDNHVHVQGADARKMMMAYLDQYMAQLRARKNMIELHPQMGWTHFGDELVFILGGEIFRRGEPPTEAGLARSAPGIAKAFTSCGNVGQWCRATETLAQPGMETLAFSFMAGAFGAPLMWFTGHSGAMVSMVGASGLGKSVTGMFLLSAYGDPEQLMLLKDDTPASMIGRLGVYGSLPAYIDEISNMESGNLSELVYRITQGRERNRLTQRGEEKSGRMTWKTLAVCSTNHPLTDRLASLKSDASAEINRIMEVRVTNPEGLTALNWRGVVKALKQNYGCAGREYVQYLVDHQDEHEAKIEKLIEELERRCCARSEERFWLATAAITIYGGLIAKKLGLHKIDLAPLMDWAVKLIKSQRVAKGDLVTNEVDVVGQFLDRFVSGGLITGKDAASGFSAVLREPRTQLVYRVMVDQQRLYVSKAALRTYLAENYGSYTGLRQHLEGLGALLSHDKRIVMGRGTSFAGSAIPCWEIDLAVPALGRQAVRLVEEAKREHAVAV